MTDTTAAAPPPADPYANPQLNCDIVMKGGITSGVVYPLAIAELAKDYRFRSIGGTSAGAIAAAAAAAAEFRRRSGAGGGGFEKLKELPEWLGRDSEHVQGSNLFALFQPQRETRPLFELLAVGMRKEGGGFPGLLRAALVAHAGWALAGAVPGLVVAAAALGRTSGAALVVFLVAALLMVVAGVATGLIIAVYRGATQTLPATGFGLCPGLPGVGCGEAPALTPWLTDLIDAVAGKSTAGAPLTFGELWRTRKPRDNHDIELQFVTTNVTHGRPHRLPYETTRLYFDPAELRRYFPERVVAWMEGHHRDSDLPPEVLGRFVPMPEPADLPVVVGARLSLSFPFLISAVPLYAIDFSRKEEKDRVPERLWFSDGGLCSNFPVHFFDRALPQWPTFDLNLREFHRDHPRDPVNEANNFRVVPSNGAGLAESWNHFDRGAGVKQIGGFAAAMVMTAKDWHDNVQLRVPGYKDRVVHVYLDPDEGGLNLQMPEELITRLGERGRLAAARLALRFSPAGDGTEMTWDNHRWLRFRSTIHLLEEELREIRETLAGDPSYDMLIHSANPPSYEWANATQRRETLAWVNRLISDSFLTAPESVSEPKTPNPRPEMRIVPRI